MANWQRTLKLQPEWDQAKDGKLSQYELAGIVAKRLKGLAAFDDEDIDGERDDIADEFECLAKDTDTTVADFDDVMERLYDWADTSLDGRFGGKKVCWVKIF